MIGAVDYRHRVIVTAQRSLKTLSDSTSTDLAKRVAAREPARSLSLLTQIRRAS